MAPASFAPTRCESGAAQARPGARALNLLSTPLNYHALRAVEDGPCSPLEMHRAVGSPPQSTMRVYIKTLIETGLLERRRQEGFPGSVEYGITPAGERLLKVATDLQHWLQDACHGPILLGTPAARNAVKALVDGWSTNIIRALAAKPLALTELHPFLPSVSYPTLERRVTAMRHVGLVEPHRVGKGRGTPYKVSNWLRRAVSPLTSAVGWEHRHLARSAGAISRVDVEATLLLTVPLLQLCPDLSGRCRLSVDLGPKSTGLGCAGVSLDVRGGTIASCVTRLEDKVDAWVSGRPLGWFGWVTRRDDASVEIGGDCELAFGLAEAIRFALVATQAPISG